MRVLMISGALTLLDSTWLVVRRKGQREREGERERLCPVKLF